MLEPTAASPSLVKRGRGRPRGSRNKPRELTTGPRLGYRINEFCKATNTSRPAVKHAISRGEIKTVWVGRCEIIPYTELKRLGYLE
jgi:hypothetical protein